MIFGGVDEIGHGWVDLEGGGNEIERGGGDELQGDDNEIKMTRLQFVFGINDELQAMTRTR